MKGKGCPRAARQKVNGEGRRIALVPIFAAPVLFSFFPVEATRACSGFESTSRRHEELKAQYIRAFSFSDLHTNASPE